MFYDKSIRHTLFTSVSVGAILLGSQAYANPLGGNVVSGDVTILVSSPPELPPLPNQVDLFLVVAFRLIR